MNDLFSYENKIGYLSPSGEFYPCPYYGHLDKALELCEQIYKETFYNGIKAENYLYNHGWVIFYSRAIGWNNADNAVLTKEQKYFILDDMEKCVIDEKINTMKYVLTISNIHSSK